MRLRTGRFQQDSLGDQLARSRERIGDQAVSIAEDAIYLLTAHAVRHGGGLRKSACPRPGSAVFGIAGLGLGVPMEPALPLQPHCPWVRLAVGSMPAEPPQQQ